jgi:hypothetical protein
MSARNRSGLEILLELSCGPSLIAFFLDFFVESMVLLTNSRAAKLEQLSDL